MTPPPHTDDSPAPIARPLLRWFRKHRRDLPWRRTQDPYAIWISEVMLQQTRVATVIPYYERFLSRFPSVAALAEADEETVLEHWAGLGYYSRGRNLHRAAQFVVRECASTFPKTAEQLRELPGVGEYTAAAVSSIAHGERVAVIDGNVERVLSRYLTIGGDLKKGLGKQHLRYAADTLVSQRHAGDYNQAVMELGATVCTPREPSCSSCPIRGGCRAHALGVVSEYPTPKKRREFETQHWLAYVFLTGENVHVARAPMNAELLAGHWGVPLERLSGDTVPTESTLRTTATRVARDSFGFEVKERPQLLTAVKHGITYRKLRIHPVVCRVVEGKRPSQQRHDSRVCALTDGGTLPALHRKVLAAVAASEEACNGSE